MLTGQRPLSNGAQIPKSNVFKEYAMVIQKMEEIDSPNIFGLPLNIDKAVQRFNTGQIMNSL